MDSLPQELDYELLDDAKGLKAKRKARKVHFAKNAQRFTKVGFDLFREDNSGSLWQLSSSDDGEEWLVRSDIQDSSLSEAEAPLQQEGATSWKAVPHKDGRFVTLAYRKTPVIIFAGQRFKFAPHEAPKFAQYLTEKTRSEEFCKKILSFLSPVARTILQGQHPELFNVVKS